MNINFNNKKKVLMVQGLHEEGQKLLLQRDDIEPITIMSANEDEIRENLKSVFDPEIPVNVVDLGLIYKVEIEDTEDRGRVAFVDLTLTAPGCGMGPVIAEDVKGKVIELHGIDDAEVEIVWDPPWTQDMISEEGKMELGLI